MNNHNRVKAYYELRAKLTLERLFPDEYSNLISWDKPDLLTQDSGIGIEITRAVTSYDEEKMAVFDKKLCGKPVVEVSPDIVKRFCADGTTLVFADCGTGREDTIIGFCPEGTWHDNELVKNAIKRKIIHINHVEYKQTAATHLYLFSNTFREYEMEDLQEIIDHVAKTQKIYAKRFHTLFFDDCGWFYRCSLDNGKIDFFNTNSILTQICQDALDCVERNC